MTAMMTSDFFPVVFRDASTYAEGGLADAADMVADAGRGGDDYIIHVNGDELRQLSEMWGEPTINPDTGMPEFFLKGLRDWFKENEWAGYALPVATGILAPGLGNSVGSAITGAFGGELSPALTNALGNGLVGAGLGALTGGGQGALMGGLLGAGTGFFATGDMPTTARGGMGPDAPKDFRTPSGESVGSGSGLSGLFGGSGSSGVLAKALPLALVASAFSGNNKPSSAHTMSGEHREASDRQNRPLSDVKFTRSRRALPRNLETYGYGPEQDFYEDNALPGYARGGMPMGHAMMAHQPPSRYVDGPGTGRSDSIPAAVSDGEYIIDAETVALLGDGSPKAGAKALDHMREDIRRHKGAALARGDISPDAKPALAYLQGGR